MDEPHWARHVPTIRRLYVTERKTLKEVKKIMEDRYGFPDIKLSTWETTLRDRFGVRKRLKKPQWQLLYQEYERRGQRPFDLYANNDLLYPWKRVWKELRRKDNAPLPQGLTLPAALNVRTPPPTELEPPTQLVHSASESAVTTTMTTHTTVSGFQYGWLDAATADIREAFRGFIRVQTERIPWNLYRLEHLAQIVGADEVYGKSEVHGSTTYALMPKDGFLDHVPGCFVDGRWLGRIADTRFPDQHWPDSTHPSFTELSTEFNAYHILNWLVYLASNRLVGSVRNASVTWEGLLELLVHRVPKRVVTAIFASNSLSIRAVWENAMGKAEQLNRQEALVFLIEMILDRHFDWVEPILNSHVLFAAARSGSAALIQKLIAKGARPYEVRRHPRNRNYRTAITEAVNAEAWDSVELLLQKCALEADLTLPLSTFSKTMGIGSQFRFLFDLIETYLSQSWRTNPEDGVRFFSRVTWSQKLSSCKIALRLFLQAGADVDVSSFLASGYTALLEVSKLQYFHQINQTPSEWLPTYLELSLYWDEQLFNYLKTYSKDQKSIKAVTRGSIVQALLDGGNDGLDQYFRAKSRPAQHVLEMILAEQFFLDIRRDWYRTARVNARLAWLLVGYGVAINSNVVQASGGIDLLLRRVIASARNFGLDEDLQFILTHLFRSGALISRYTLQLAVSRSGVLLLEILASHGADISRDGKLALLLAVNLENYEAVQWLLDKGVSIASSFLAGELPSSYTVIGASISPLPRGLEEFIYAQIESSSRFEPLCARPDGQLSIRMIRFLYSRGAQLSLKSSESSPFELLIRVRVIDGAEECLAFMVDLPHEMAKLTDFEREKLYGVWGFEIACNQHILESLQSRYEDFDTGFLLADAIKKGANDDVIERLLADASDIDILCGWPHHTTPLHAAAYVCNQRLVQVLLDRGADIDGRASEGGLSPLATLCSYRPSTSEQVEARQSLIKLLIDRGANCSCAPNDFLTPLNSLARHGDLELLCLFLERGVDPNYVCYDSESNAEGDTYLIGDSPLDESVLYGRLDATHLLLKVGGLSAEPGHTGYEGAIKWATNGAVRELIHRHIEQMKNNFVQDPELEQKHRAMVDQQIRRREQVARDLGVHPYCRDDRRFLW